jgi:uncharacterized short protein YbdD (DUF466 family)
LAQQSRAAPNTRRPLNAAVDMRINNPDHARVAEALARRSRAMSNPFYNDDDESGLELPPDDERYHYANIRYSINGQTDTTNMRHVLNSRLNYEPVPIDELPAEWQRRFGSTMIKTGDFAGFIGRDDTMVMRCSRRAYDQWLEAKQTKADDYVMGTRADFLAECERRGWGGGYKFDQDSGAVEDWDKDE